MVDFKALEDKVAALAELIPKIKADYAAMIALIAELKAVVDGTDIQAKVDALTAQLTFSADALAAVEAEFPAPAPVA